ncbi:hypothetical protein B0G81_8646 [Paraburkholderia sp. BL6665CI2N2]|uniref:serine hydrolase domain-containing protein n=1 Tax=Paraburkholderia sp. BL6665CI2N2 TaxID=1938806 RepID=UPI0010668BD9|nr:serine hydrolase [Paraburkholderia sp. BL6665CI2N2]TDY15580.1 hypothetical protein B0G81_8646 [Paraburkholderia sp. BL6665CI2N2]
MKPLNHLGKAITSADWLDVPTNRIAFRKIEDVLPIAKIDNGLSSQKNFEQRLIPSEFLSFQDSTGVFSIEKFLEDTYTDGFLILHSGKIAYEWYTPTQSNSDRHIVFSVTKSVVGSLVGVLIDQGKIDPSEFVPHYVPELRGTAFDQVRVQHLLDMTVSLDFTESYLDPSGAYARYRRSVGWSGSEIDSTHSGMHAFLTEIPLKNQPHGSCFDYLSPNSDVLGWVCERAANGSLAALLSSHIWQPLQAESSAYITVDSLGAPRAAGGFGCTLRDMARFGECMRNDGNIDGRQIIPASWIERTIQRTDSQAWKAGAMADWIPGGGYKNQWWLTNNKNNAYFAAGIYGHWIYIDPTRGVVIVKQTSRPEGPATKEMFQYELGLYGKLAEIFR